MNSLKRILVTRVNLLGHWKSLGIRKRFAVIHHSNAEAGHTGRLRHGRRNMPSAE